MTGLDALPADEVRSLLGLEPHPTCGFVNVNFVSSTAVPSGALPPPFQEGRALGSALVFMVTPEAPVHLHCIRNDQLYHRYGGEPLEVLMLRPDGTHHVAVVGPDLRSGHVVQLFIPGGTFHTARVVGGAGWFLGASTEWPGVDPSDVVVGDPVELSARFPAAAGLLRDFLVR